MSIRLFGRFATGESSDVRAVGEPLKQLASRLWRNTMRQSDLFINSPS